MSRKAWLWEFRNKSNVNRACELKCRADDFLLVPAGCISLSPFSRQRSWRCKAANLWQPGSAVGKTMVASSLTGRRSQGRKGRKGADRRSKLVGGNWQTHSQRERTSTFLVIKVLPVYLSFRNASIEIFQNQGRRNGERSQGERLMLRTECWRIVRPVILRFAQERRQNYYRCAIRRTSIAVRFAQLDIDRSWEIYRSDAGLSSC